MRAYRLLVEVMEREERVALGRFVMRTKEYLAAVPRPRRRPGADDDALRRRGPRPAATFPTGGKKPTRKGARQRGRDHRGALDRWDPENYEDCYRKRLKRVIDRKRKGAKIEAARAGGEPKPAPDLMAALEETLDRIKAGDEVAAVREAAAKGRRLAGAQPNVNA